MHAFDSYKPDFFQYRQKNNNVMHKCHLLNFKLTVLHRNV